ncbi:MAG: hypothetical protein H0U74_09005 [Bradymonadaceae bacterium]|nr:hypothetical protein [Lujinxingiaceae bacterium]
MRNLISIVLIAGLAMAAPVSTAFAQQPADQSEIARKVEVLSSQGAQKYRAQDFSGAIDAFKQAYELESVPNLLYNIAKCYEKIEDWDNAIVYYERFVVAPDVESEARQHALAQVQKLRERNANASDPNDPRPAGDDRDKDQLPLTPDPKPKSPDRTVAYITLGSGVGLLAIGGTFGWLASVSEQEFRNADPTDTAGRQAAQETGSTRALIADGLFIVGGVVTVIGTYLFITATPSDTAAASGVAFSPWFSPSGAGLGMSLGF